MELEQIATELEIKAQQLRLLAAAEKSNSFDTLLNEIENNGITIDVIKDGKEYTLTITKKGGL